MCRSMQGFGIIHVTLMLAKPSNNFYLIMLACSKEIIINNKIYIEAD